MNPKDITKHYTNGEVTIVWQSGKCIHSAMCVRGLPEVFNFSARPWINTQAANTSQMVEQVKQCPSGALSYFMNDANDQEAEKMEARVEVMPNGPLLVYGTLKIKDKAGNETVRNKTTAFCRCGGSNNKPYCDGSHMNNGFKDE